MSPFPEAMEEARAHIVTDPKVWQPKPGPVVRLRAWGGRRRDQLDGWLHPLRRRRALRRLSRSVRPAKVVFVCEGNICRSPFAHRALQRRQDEAGADGLAVDSAGFLESGRASPGEAVQAASLRGLKLAAHRSRRLEPEMAEPDVLFVVMEPRQVARLRDRLGAGIRTPLVLGDLDPLRIETRRIIDPLDHSADFFLEVYDRIDRCVAELRDALSPSGAG